MENSEQNIEIKQEPQAEKPAVNQTTGTKSMVSVLIVLVTILLGVVFLRGSKPPESPVRIEGVEVGTENSGTAVESGIRPVSSDEHIVGSANAKIVIVEYSDTECPFCKMFHNTMKQVVQDNNGNVAWVYRHFPIAQLHPKAFHESEATECAWEQGGNDAFWKYTNEVYSRTNSNNSLPVEQLSKIAGSVGLNTQAFNDCLESGKWSDKVNADIMDGQMNKVQGTPSSFILVDGKVVDTIDGAQPYEAVQAKIDALLK